MSDTQKYLEALFRDAPQVELRHQLNGRWTSGWYDNSELLLRDARQLANQGNLFTSLNTTAPFRPSNSMMGDPQGYINEQINKGVANASVQQEFQRRFPDVPLTYASHVASEHSAELDGLDTNAAMTKVADICRQTLGPAKQQQNSTGSILRRRREARREARLGFVAKQSKA